MAEEFLNNDTGIILDTETPDDWQPTITFEQSAVLPDTMELQERVPQVMYALGHDEDDQVAERDVSSDLQRLGEFQLRTREAAIADYKAQINKTNYLRDFVFNRPQDVTREEIEFIRQIDTRKHDPNTIIEELYARRKTNEIAATPVETVDPDYTTTGTYPHTLYDAAAATNEDAANVVLTGFETILAQQEIDKKLIGEVSKEMSGASYGTIFTEVLTDGFIPFWQWYHTARQGDGYWLGDVFEKQRNELKAEKDPAVYEKKLRGFLDNYGPIGKMQFMQGMMHYSSSDAFMRNIQSGADLVSLGGTAVLATGKLALTLQAAAKALATKAPMSSKMLDAMGLLKEAQIARHLDKFKAKAKMSGTTADDILEEGYSLHNPQRVLEGADTTMSMEKQKRFAIWANSNGARLLDALVNAIPVDRLARGSQALHDAYQVAEAEFKQLYKGVENSILNVTAIKKDDTLNVDSIVIEIGEKRVQATVKGKKKGAKKAHPIAVQMGTPGADLFKDAERAAWYATNEIGLPAGSFTVENRGLGFYIQVIKHVDETADTVRDALLIETTVQTPQSKFGAIRNFLRNPDLKVGKAWATEMKAIYGLTKTIAALKYATRDIQALSGRGGIIKETVSKFLLGDREWQRFNKYVSRQQQTINNLTGKPGMFNKNMGDFTTDWHNMFGRLPNEKETRAYWAYRQVNDIDYAAYNAGVWLGKARQGLMDLSLPYTKSVMGLANEQSMTTFEGKFLKDGLPYTLKDKDPLAGVLIWDPNADTMKRLPFKYTSKDDLDALIKKNGYTVFQTDRYGEESLRGVPELTDKIPEGAINFILAKGHKTAPLSLQQIPYQPGGHVEYASGWFIRQPKIAGTGSDTTYFGDVNLRGGFVEKDAKKYVERYNKGRLILKEEMAAKKEIERLQAIENPSHKTLDKIDELKRLAESKQKELSAYLKKNLPEEYTDFRRYFEGKSARLDVDTPLYVTRKAEHTRDVAVDELGNKGLRNFKDSTGKVKYPNFREAKDSPFNLYNTIDLRFGLEKNEPIYKIAQEGTAQNPLYKTVPARIVDPSVSMDSTARHLMRGRYLGDFKHKAAEQFIQEFGHLFDGVSKEEMRRNPYKWLTTSIPSGKGGAEYRAAVAFQRTTTEFMHIKDIAEQEVNTFRHRMLERVMNISEDVGIAAEPYLLHRIKDPVHYMRSVAFHMKMLAPHQLFMQASTVVHASSFVGPKEGLVSTMLSSYMRGLQFTDEPAIISKMANNAKEMWGMDPKHFTEMYDGFMRSGMLDVGHEVAMRGDYTGAPVMEFGAGKVLDIGRWFFNEGERISRSAAWTMAYRAWRKKSPNAVFDDQALKFVRRKADDMTGNMTAANNASWQRGYWGIPTQFWGYPVRVAEQFMGKKLTGAERRNMFLTYSAVYGWPNGINLAVPVWPMAESARAYLLEKGIDTDANELSKIMTNGLAGYVTEQLLGENYNVSERYGLGLTVLRDLVYGDKTFFETLAGASGTTVWSMLKSLQPVLTDLMGLADEENLDYDFTFHDAINILDEQAAVNNAKRWYMATNYHHFFTKKGKAVAPMTGKDGMVGFFTGLIPQHVSDTFLLSDNFKNRDKYNKQILDDAETWIKRALGEGVSKDDQKKYRDRAFALIHSTDLTPQQKSNWIQQVGQRNYSMLEELFKKTQSAGTEADKQIVIDRIKP
jgi:hypothetical protein